MGGKIPGGGAVKKAIRKIKALLCLWFPRYKLRCIIKALGLETRPWQIKYALCRSEYMPTERQTGKTVAATLRTLMLNQKCILDWTEYAELDPDYKVLAPHTRYKFYRTLYHECYIHCIQAGIPVPVLCPRMTCSSSREVKP